MNYDWTAPISAVTLINCADDRLNISLSGQNKANEPNINLSYNIDVEKKYTLHL